MNNTSLHLLRVSPFQDNKINLLVNCLTSDDTVVLIDDGCYLNNHPLLAEVLLKCQAVFAIAPHMLARALVNREQVSLISLERLNNMLFTHKNSVTWQ